MSDDPKQSLKLPPEQQAIRNKCFHPSGTFVEFPMEDVETSIPARFEKIVRLYPDRLAICTDGAQITYDELNRTANRIARSLIQSVGDADLPIVLLLDEGIEAVAAMMAILKAGRFYVQLPPSTPRQRLISVLDDSGAVNILVERKNLSLLDGFVAKGLAILDVSALGRGQSDENLTLAVAAQAPCAIRYTSGTTGEPKGVVHNHIKVLQTALANTNNLYLCCEDRCAAHGHDYFNSLLVGAAYYPCKIVGNGWRQFARWLIDNQITTYDTVPAVFRQFCSTLSSSSLFPHLRVIKLEGESALKNDVEFYKKCFNDHCILINRFGTRETGGLRQYLVDKTTTVVGDSLPAGYAMGGKKVLILDEQGSEVQPGSVGEIAVVSRYIASSYWRRPDWTRQAFVPVDDGGSIMYRTGDVGRLRADGCLEHLGRKDDQVKIGGQVLHPAEVEAALSECAGVHQAAVKVWATAENQHCLTAYICLAPACPFDVRQIRRSLREKLPDYKVPARFVLVDEFQLGPTGKIDRSTLARPENSRPMLLTAFVAGRTPTEAKLAAMWAEVLQLERVGIFDQFFELGGTSLSAMRVVCRVLQSFKLDLPVRILFDAPTVAEMAAIIDQSRAKPVSDDTLAQMLREVESMTEEEAVKLLSAESAQRAKGNCHE